MGIGSVNQIRLPLVSVPSLQRVRLVSISPNDSLRCGFSEPLLVPLQMYTFIYRFNIIPRSTMGLNAPNICCLIREVRRFWAFFKKIISTIPSIYFCREL